VSKDAKIGLFVVLVLVVLVAVIWSRGHEEVGTKPEESKAPSNLDLLSLTDFVEDEAEKVEERTGPVKTYAEELPGKPLEKKLLIPEKTVHLGEGIGELPEKKVEPPPPTHKVVQRQTYKIQPGDMLSEISRKFYGTTAKWRLIAKANSRLEDPHMLSPGTEIVIPELRIPLKKTVGPAFVPAGAKTYTVQKGDTLSDISRELYGTTQKWMFLWEANKATVPSPKLLRPGMVLVVPPLAPTRSATTTAGLDR